MVDTGLDKQQIEDLKKWIAGVIGDPAKLRLYVCVLMLAVGWLGVVRPMGERLATAQTDLKKIKTAARRAANSAHYVGQRKLYEPKLTNRDDVVFWQAYIMRKLDASGAVLDSLEPSATTAKFQFKILRLIVTARASHYQDVVDFVDRIEHGELAVRLETMAIDETTDGLLFSCMLQCLVKPGLVTPASKQAPPKPGGAVSPGDDGDADAGQQPHVQSLADEQALAAAEAIELPALATQAAPGEHTEPGDHGAPDEDMAGAPGDGSPSDDDQGLPAGDPLSAEGGDGRG